MSHGDDPMLNRRGRTPQGPSRSTAVAKSSPHVSAARSNTPIAAAKDAADVVGLLFGTQVGPFNSMGGLYAHIWPQLLRDGEADRAGIFRALGSMKANMAKDPVGQDLAVVFFSGHGALIDERFYLLPYG